MKNEFYINPKVSSIRFDISNANIKKQSLIEYSETDILYNGIILVNLVNSVESIPIFINIMKLGDGSLSITDNEKESSEKDNTTIVVTLAFQECKYQYCPKCFISDINTIEQIYDITAKGHIEFFSILCNEIEELLQIPNYKMELMKHHKGE